MARRDVVTRAAIRPEVVSKIAHAARRDGDLPDETRLHEDLGLGTPVLRALALPFSRISLEHGGLAIAPDETEDLTTVGKSVDLVFERANGRG